MSYHPKNVQQMVAQSEMTARAAGDAKVNLRHQINSVWAERDFQRRSKQGLDGAGVVTSAPTSSSQSKVDMGVQTGVAAVKVQRQARLKELFEVEAVCYEKELNALGLSLVKPRV